MMYLKSEKQQLQSNKYLLLCICVSSLFPLCLYRYDLKTANILEGIAIKWCYQLNDVLEENSLALFRNDVHPTPIFEYNFWKRRFLNLQNIYIQLSESNRKLIMDILDKNNSVYIDPLKGIFQRIITALMQAKHVKIHMKAYTQQLKVVQTTAFHQCKDLIEPILHVTCIMWRENPFYPSANWSLLFQMIVNMIIDESNKNLDIDAIFQSDIEESRFKIRETIQVFDYFK